MIEETIDRLVVLIDLGYCTSHETMNAIADTLAWLEEIKDEGR